MILTITLNPAIDLGLSVPAWQEGKVNRATGSHQEFGGKGINVTRMLSELGAKTRALTIVGSESVPKIKRLLSEQTFPVTYIRINGETRTNVHIYDTNGERVLKVNQAGETLDQSDFDHFKLLFKTHLKNCTFVAAAGSLPPGLPEDGYAQLAHLCAQERRRFVIDAEGPALLKCLKEGVYLVKINREELARSLDAKLNNEKSILKACEKLRQLGSSNIVVTDGGRPFYACTEEGIFKGTPPKIKVAGETGAGDSFTAGILCSLDRGEGWQKALQLGVQTSAATCLLPEGILASREHLDEQKKFAHIEMLSPAES